MNQPNPYEPPHETSAAGGKSWSRTITSVLIVFLNLGLIQAIIILAIVGLALLMRTASL